MALVRGSARSVAQQVVAARWLLPVWDETHANEPLWLEDHALVLEGDRIAAVLPREEAWKRYPSAERVCLSEHALLPGLINAHTHAAMSLFRGLGDDQALDTWLRSVIWPLERELVDEHFVRDGSMLAVAELLRSGCTTLNDMYWYPEVTAQVCREAGMRAVLGMVVVDFPSRYGSGPEEYFQKASRLTQIIAEGTLKDSPENPHREIPLMESSYAPHATYSVSEEILREVGKRAMDEGRRVHIHMHETAAEVKASQTLDRGVLVCHRSEFAGAPLDNLERLGLLAANWTLVHMVHVTDAHIELVRRRGASVVHCPASNLKLGSGVFPLTKMLDAGINVALGTDSAASNNRLDMWAEMRLAALLAKGSTGRSDCLTAYQVLRMATIQGARALGLDHLLGSLEPGKAADFIAVRVADGLSTMPVHDVCSALVYGAGPDQVTDVWIGARRVVHDGVLQTISQAKLVERIRHWHQRIRTLGSQRGEDGGYAATTRHASRN
jgi:5-methylthioadenosine/S-adenosylhomocysteine deaminase